MRFILLLLCALTAPSAIAQAPRQLDWEDLTVKLSAADNPFAALSMEHLRALIDVAVVRDRRARGANITPDDTAREKKALDELARAKLDVDGLLAKRAEVAEKQRAIANATNPALDGALVRLPGYLLPLEFTGKQVSEFLLVPWVGACVHTPPPPPNQIVHVVSDKPFEISGMFDAVWVTGRMATTASKRSVQIVDGAADVDIGYALRASRVEPYRRN